MDSLEKLVKSTGDECVAGYVRFKKIKPCNGYKKARDRAAYHLSKIKGGRPMGNNLYAAVVRFRLIVFLIPLFLLTLAGVFIMTRQTKVKAIERPTEKSEEIIMPEETVMKVEWQESQYAGLYITVPGFSDCTWNSNEHSLLVYNPVGNECVMAYQVYINGELVTQSELLSSGESAVLDFYDRVTTGVYEMKVIAKAYSVDLETEFNSVYQKIQLTVY